LFDVLSQGVIDQPGPEPSRFVDSQTAEVSVPPQLAFQPILRIGGSNGWHFANFLWRNWGLLDLLVGGVGMRRGRVIQSIWP